MIVNEMDHVDKDLNLICNDFQLSYSTALGVLCCLEYGQHIIIELSANEDGITLPQNVQSLGYVDRFKSLLKIVCNKHKIDYTEKLKEEQRTLQAEKGTKREIEIVPKTRLLILFSMLRLSKFLFHNRYVGCVI